MKDETQNENLQRQAADADDRRRKALAMRLVGARKEAEAIEQFAHEISGILKRGVTSLVVAAQVWDLTAAIKNGVASLEKAVCELTGSGPAIPGARTPEFSDLDGLGEKHFDLAELAQRNLRTRLPNSA
jgi:hypothetical protein